MLRTRSWLLAALSMALAITAARGFAPSSSAVLARRSPSAPTARRVGRTRRMAFDPEGGGKKITRDNEPEEFFSSDFEKLSAEEKFKDPLVILGLVSVLLPFVLTAGLIGTGVIEL